LKRAFKNVLTKFGEKKKSLKRNLTKYISGDKNKNGW
jgi:hypothetical protein